MIRPRAITRFQSAMRAFDWLLAGGSLGYGCYAASALWIASGVIGFGLAWYNPAARLRKRFTVMRPPPAHARRR